MIFTISRNDTYCGIYPRTKVVYTIFGVVYTTMQPSKCQACVFTCLR